MGTTDGPLAMETTYVWRDEPGGGTRMSIRNRGEAGGFAAIAAPLLERSMRKANREDLGTAQGHPGSADARIGTVAPAYVGCRTGYPHPCDMRPGGPTAALPRLAS